VSGRYLKIAGTSCGSEPKMDLTCLIHQLQDSSEYQLDPHPVLRNGKLIPFQRIFMEESGWELTSVFSLSQKMEYSLENIRNKIRDKEVQLSSVNSIMEDNSEIIWMGTYEGLVKIDLKRKNSKYSIILKMDFLSCQAIIFFLFMKTKTDGYGLGRGDLVWMLSIGNRKL